MGKRNAVIGAGERMPESAPRRETAATDAGLRRRCLALKSSRTRCTQRTETRGATDSRSH
jgi:hypothetical protein